MAFEKSEKEKLTDDLIQQDILYGFRNDSHLATNIILVAVSVFLAFCLQFLTPYAWFVLLIPALFLLFWYIKRKKKIEKIKNYEFTVVLDELLYEKQGALRTGATFYKGKWISYLQFSNCGRWEIEGTYYSRSNQYKMSSTGICNTSSPKDRFYVALYQDTKEIAIAYNTKFFDYQP